MREQESALLIAVMLMLLDQGPPLEPLHTMCPITQKTVIVPVWSVF